MPTPAKGPPRYWWGGPTVIPAKAGIQSRPVTVGVAPPSFPRKRESTVAPSPDWLAPAVIPAKVGIHGCPATGEVAPPSFPRKRESTVAPSPDGVAPPSLPRKRESTVAPSPVGWPHRHSRESGNPRLPRNRWGGPTVIPAKVGIHGCPVTSGLATAVIPAKAGIHGCPVTSEVAPPSFPRKRESTAAPSPAGRPRLSLSG